MNNSFIYVITTFQKVECNDKGFIEYGSSRSVGWFETYEEALNIVENNIGDLNETIYDYAVIEKLGCGLYPVCNNLYERHYFVFDYETCKYKIIDKSQIELLNNVSQVWSLG